MLCVKCHKEIPEDSKFCLYCGANQKSPARSAHKRGNGQGSVFKRGSTWAAQWTVYTLVDMDADGKLIRMQKRRTKCGFLTKKDALAYLETLRTERNTKTHNLLYHYEQWKRVEMPKLSIDRQRSSEIARRRLDTIMGVPVDALTLDALQNCIDANATSYYTARDMKTLASHILERAIRNGEIENNISKHVVLPQLKEKEPEPFSADEIEKMWSAYADGDTFIGYLLVMIYSGMMPGELFACRKDMIDFDKREIYGCGKKTKTRKNGVIVFADCVGPVLEALCEFADGDKLVAKHETQWYDEYHKATQRIGIRDLPPYACRHTTGTEAAKLGLSAPVLQRLMRHSRITTTQRYIHLGESATHDSLNALSQGTPGGVRNS